MTVEFEERKSATQLSAKARLIACLNQGIDHEMDLQWAKVAGPNWTSAQYQPAVINAYRRIRALLDQPVSPRLLEQIHAEVCGIFEQPCYGGAQLELCCILVDEWLGEMQPGHGLPSVLRLFHARRAPLYTRGSSPRG